MGPASIFNLTFPSPIVSGWSRALSTLPSRLARAFMWTNVFSSLWSRPRSGIAGSHGNFIATFFFKHLPCDVTHTTQSTLCVWPCGFTTVAELHAITTVSCRSFSAPGREPCPPRSPPSSSRPLLARGHALRLHGAACSGQPTLGESGSAAPLASGCFSERCFQGPSARHQCCAPL